ncbi:CIA30 family protein [Shewanella sp. 10N.286.52.C2]|uniref:CIA30 family protein n=1 Tax=Shewanella sp. 10N.286.52.C2 TaxID=1880838 RepID=UPI000C8659F0|nr:CIA30 family protein [Shewanella sp. 10N.286.52.C2]
MLKLSPLFIVTLVLFHLLSIKALAMEIQFDNPNHVTEAKISNDTVMGGLSASQLDSQQGQNAVFSGNVSLDNNGGFASIEFQLRQTAPYSDRITLRVFGDGKRYQLRLKTAKLSFGEAYAADFDTQAGQWSEHTFTVTDFQPRFRGRNISAPALKFADISRIGLLIAAKQQGPFSITLDTLIFDSHI